MLTREEYQKIANALFRGYAEEEAERFVATFLKVPVSEPDKNTIRRPLSDYYPPKD